MLARAFEISQAHPALAACSDLLAKLKQLVPISQYQQDLQTRVTMRIVRCSIRDDAEFVQLSLCLCVRAWMFVLSGCQCIFALLNEP